MTFTQWLLVLVVPFLVVGGIDLVALASLGAVSRPRRRRLPRFHMPHLQVTVSWQVAS